MALVDDDDYEYLSQFDWQVAKHTQNCIYAKRGGTEKREIKMHRQIMGVTDPKVFIDHIDHNGLNNQKSNLRICTAAQNSANKMAHKNSKSKYQGVTWDNRSQRWVVRIRIGGVCLYRKYIKDEIEAAKLYDEAAKIHHGEFANLNFPTSPL